MQISVEILGASKASVFLDAFPREASKAILRALKRGNDSAGTRANRVVALDTGLKVGEVSKRIRRIDPTGATLTAELRGSLKRIPLIEFPARQRKALHAFVATMPGGHRGIFRRDPLKSTRRGPKPNRSGLPIVELKGPSVGRVMIKHQGEIVSVGEHEFEKELDRLLNRIIQGGVNNAG